MEALIGANMQYLGVTKSKLLILLLKLLRVLIIQQYHFFFLLICHLKTYQLFLSGKIFNNLEIILNGIISVNEIMEENFLLLLFSTSK